MKFSATVLRWRAYFAEWLNMRLGAGITLNSAVFAAGFWDDIPWSLTKNGA
jgi:hypothetical protein